MKWLRSKKIRFKPPLAGELETYRVADCWDCLNQDSCDKIEKFFNFRSHTGCDLYHSIEEDDLRSRDYVKEVIADNWKIVKW